MSDKIPRKIVQVMPSPIPLSFNAGARSGTEFYALADDGTLWAFTHASNLPGQWKQMPTIPAREGT